MQFLLTDFDTHTLSVFIAKTLQILFRTTVQLSKIDIRLLECLKKYIYFSLHTSCTRQSAVGGRYTNIGQTQLLGLFDNICRIADYFVLYSYYNLLRFIVCQYNHMKQRLCDKIEIFRQTSKNGNGFYKRINLFQIKLFPK